MTSRRDGRLITFTAHSVVASATVIDCGSFADYCIRALASYSGGTITWYCCGTDNGLFSPLYNFDSNIVTTASGDINTDRWVRLPEACFPANYMKAICASGGPFAMEMMQEC
jgi:hypothetical protein